MVIFFHIIICQSQTAQVSLQRFTLTETEFGGWAARLNSTLQNYVYR